MCALYEVQHMPGGIIARLLSVFFTSERRCYYEYYHIPLHDIDKTTKNPSRLLDPVLNLYELKHLSNRIPPPYSTKMNTLPQIADE